MRTRGLPGHKGREGRPFLPFEPGTTEDEYDSVPRRIATDISILLEDDLRRPLIQILHLTFMSHSVVFMSLFDFVITTLTRALGKIPRHVHLAPTSSSSLPQFPGGFHFLRARNSFNLAVILGTWYRAGRMWNNSRR